MRTGALHDSSAAPEPPTWPRPPATWARTTRVLGRQALIEISASQAGLILLCLGVAALRHEPAGQAMVKHSYWLILILCIITGRTARTLRAALNAGLPRHTALASGLALVTSFALAWVLRRWEPRG